MAENNNQGKTALITGATSGIGYELAKLFAKDGYDLVLVARAADRLQAVSEEFKQQYDVEVHTIEKDLFTPGAARQVYDETKKSGLTIDALVNNAGQGEYGRFIDTDLDREIDLVHLDIISVISLTKFYLKEMADRNEGKILQLASNLSKAPTPLMSVYAASKAFVLSFTEALIEEMKESEVIITALLPGPTDTDFFHKAGAEVSVTYKEMPIYDPAEVAKAGYKGLMSGKSKVIPGAMNKAEAAMGTVLPDGAVTAMMSKQMKPSEKEGGREAISHPASAAERASMHSREGDLRGHEGHVHEEQGA
ncbi:MAG: SDR family oxidoreductase [Williamsia sp.]|nr:SDR family oxidoreductase [Williamsia sp.]